MVSSLAGAIQVGTRLSIEPIPLSPEPESKLDDYLITGITPVKNNQTKVTLIEYNVAFLRPGHFSK